MLKDGEKGKSLRLLRYTEAMNRAAAAELIPLEADSQGVLRVAGTHVTLDMVVEMYRAGNTAEDIARQQPSLQLADVYAVLTYYLRHQMEVDTYIRRRREEAAAPPDSLLPLPPAGFGPELEMDPKLEWEPTSAAVDLLGGMADRRSRLLARKHSGEKLSSGEEKHLEILTARLKEALPPVSSQELEALLAMTNEVALIRERARERRQRLGLS